MKLQFDNLLVSSTKLWLEHTILKKGAAFTNTSSYFYPVQNVWNGYYTYAAPYQPFVSDYSITGANLLSGVYLDNTFITTGQSGLVQINYEKGELYFNTPISNKISGNYSVADFNIQIANAPDETLLFERKYDLKNKAGNGTISGLGNNDLTYPLIIMKSYGGRNDPYAFGGLDKQMLNIRLIVLADSAFLLDAVGSLIKEEVRTLIPMVTGASEMPFDNLGGYSNNNYNYDTLMAGRNQMSNSIWAENIDVSTLTRKGYTVLKAINPAVFVGLIDINVEAYRIGRGAS